MMKITSSRLELKPMTQSRLFLPVLGIFIVIYLCIGAAVFSALEQPFEVESSNEMKYFLSNISIENNLSAIQLNLILKSYQDFIDSKNYDITAFLNIKSKWDFLGAFVFSGTAITTIGFGTHTPRSPGGKLVFVFYALIGCSSVFLFFNSWLVRFIESFAWLVSTFNVRRMKKKGENTANYMYVPSPYYVMLALSLLTSLVIFIPAIVYHKTEMNWSYTDAFYYSFTAFSTIGFGDFVSGQDKTYGINIYFYNVIDAFCITLGCCCFYSLFNMISFFIKKFVHKVVEAINKNIDNNKRCCSGDQRISASYVIGFQTSQYFSPSTSGQSEQLNRPDELANPSSAQMGDLEANMERNDAVFDDNIVAPKLRTPITKRQYHSSASSLTRESSPKSIGAKGTTKTPPKLRDRVLNNQLSKTRICRRNETKLNESLKIEAHFYNKVAQQRRLRRLHSVPADHFNSRLLVQEFAEALRKWKVEDAILKSDKKDSETSSASWMSDSDVFPLSIMESKMTPS